jgi:glycoprotein endo-alpha-1,2-mannosidase
MLRRLAFIAAALLLASCSSSRFVSTPSIIPSSTPEPGPTATLPPVTNPAPPLRVAAFYYPWYGTPQFDHSWIHWTQNGHIPPQDIASDYYPALGPYSSGDPSVVAQHMVWLRQAGIGVIIVSWWGKDSSTDRAIPLILQMAERYGIRVAFHIEPYSSRTAAGLVEDVKYLYGRYGTAPAFFRSSDSSTYSAGQGPKGVFFVWCVGSSGTCGEDKVPHEYWQNAVDEIHSLPEPTLLIANSTSPSWITASHFDGLYNYSTLHLDKKDFFAWAQSLPPGALYIPSVIPGFSAKRVGYPADTYVDRADGMTYNLQWTAALGADVPPDMVTITSFNEWHEGSMIEPLALGKDDGHGYHYADFGSMPPDGYLTLTRQWVDKFASLFPSPASTTGISP